MIRQISVLILLVTLLGCGTENPFSRGAETLGDTSINLSPGEDVSFSLHVIPALSTCASCHRSGAGGWTYNGGATAYSAVIDIVDRSNPEQSELLISATGGDNHGGGSIFSIASTEYETILLWVEQGALNN